VIFSVWVLVVSSVIRSDIFCYVFQGASSSAFASASCSDDQKSQEALFNEIFSQADPASIETFLSSLMSGDSTKLDEQFQSFESTPSPAHGNVAETLQQTLGSLLQNTQQLQQDDNITEEEIMQMMSNLGMDGDMPGEGDFLPMMQTMMKDLLSKDVLHPSLKEITAQYPAWLSNNKGKIDDEQYTKYEQQFQLMSTITNEFEEEEPSDSNDVKRQRFERILDMMQRMQEFGQPPKEIVGDMPNGFELDADGLPKLPTGMLPNPEQCCIM